jgi:hypothetical protein
MEWALTIPRGQALEWLAESADLEKGPLAAIWEAGEDQFGTINFTRLYFGQEFCEKALPTLKELTKAIETAEQKGMEFTLVTPYVTEEGLSEVKVLLEHLVKLMPQAEVVVNDWGVLEILNQNYPSLTPVLGRLLNKVIRDPRMLAYHKKAQFKISQEKSLEDFCQSYRRSNLAGEPMQALLASYKVTRIEMDLPPQGLDEQLKIWGYDSSLYLPYGVITTGRICLLHSWGVEEKQKFKPFVGACDRKCRYYWLDMADPSGQVPKSKDWTIVQKGNTVFYRENKDFIRKGLAKAAQLGINRVIIQREPL